jgi:uncharacterized membrane protein
MCVAGIAAFAIAIAAARKPIAAARGLEKVIALTGVCVAVPLAVFGALHLFGPRFVTNLVPAYMPWRMFWVYGVGVALVAASLSIAVDVAVGWSGLLLGLMMFSFVAMIHLRGALATPHERIIWMIVFREMSFGGAGWMLAGMASDAGPRRRTLVLVGRALATATILLFGVEHFLHPTGLPGVPLAKQIPAWVPARAVVDYVTGALLLAAGLSSVANRYVRTAAACAGAWLLLMLIAIYAPVLVHALGDPKIGTQLEGVNYFADTLLFTGVVLSLAKVSLDSGRAGR